MISGLFFKWTTLLFATSIQALATNGANQGETVGLNFTNESTYSYQADTNNDFQT